MRDMFDIEDAKYVETCCKKKATLSAPEDFAEILKYMEGFFKKHHPGNTDIVGTEICYRVYYNEIKKGEMK